MNHHHFILIILGALCISSCVATSSAHQKKILGLQQGRYSEDTSYVYSLPYQEGKRFLVVQGYFSIFSHKNRAALDIKMKPGTPITAVRDGVVIRMKEDGQYGGWQRKYRSEGNFVTIQHEDGTRAGYWHLQYQGALVEVGDTVTKGQVIGLSGKTGLALFPHLHFLVWTNKDGQWKQVGTRFETTRGPQYLKPFRFFQKPYTPQLTAAN